MALYEDLKLFSHLNLHHVLVKSDSTIIVHAMRDARVLNWSQKYLLKYHLIICKESFKIEHVYHQNLVVNYLVDLAHLHHNCIPSFRGINCPQGFV